jgi:hypothetical protein
MNRPSVIDIHRKWDPRIGRKAAQRFAVYVWATFLMLPLGLVLFATLVLASRFPNLSTHVLAGVAIAAAFANATLIWLAPVLARRQASRTLRIKVTYKNYPPNDLNQYRSWCVTNHIRPFEADSSH